MSEPISPEQNAAVRPPSLSNTHKRASRRAHGEQAACARVLASAGFFNRAGKAREKNSTNELMETQIHPHDQSLAAGAGRHTSNVGGSPRTSLLATPYSLLPTRHSLLAT